jgi:hypothetical protein
MLINKEVDAKLKEQFATLAEPVRRIVLDGVYKRATKQATESYTLDEEALAGVQMEVLLFLVGIQNKAELRELLENHPSLTAEQGAEVMSSLEKSLFAPLANYLPNDGEGEGGAGVASLLDAINENATAAERMGKLPAGVQEVIKGDGLQKAFVNLVRKHALSPDIAAILAQHVSVVLVGLGTTNDFKVNVTKDTGLDPSKLEAVFQDVEISLFKPVRTAILTALEQKKAGTVTAATPAPGNDPYRTDAL